MKKTKSYRPSELSVDVIDYMFTEWLVRRGLFSAYKANYEKFTTNHRSFRDNLRFKIRSLCRSSVLGVENIISTSFPFTMTSEGYDFWAEQSAIWRRFCSDFNSKF